MMGACAVRMYAQLAASCASSTPHKVVTQQLLSMLLQPYGSPDVFAWDAG